MHINMKQKGHSEYLLAQHASEIRKYAAEDAGRIALPFREMSR